MPETEQCVSNNNSKANHIYQSLIDLVREGVYKSGDKLPNERALADRFNTGRAVVRDALLMVQNQGLIVRRVGSGTFISDEAARLIEIQDAEVQLDQNQPFNFNEILEARLLFEPGVAGMAAANAGPREVAELENRLETLGRANCWLEFKEAIYLVTKGIYEATGNIFLVSVFDHVIRCRRQVNYNGRATRSKVSDLVKKQAVAELQEIVQAIADGDGKKAASLSQDYLLKMFASVNL